MRSSLMPPVMTSGPSRLLARSNLLAKDFESSPSTLASAAAVTVTVCGRNQSVPSKASDALDSATSGSKARMPRSPAPRCVRVGSALRLTVTVSPAAGALLSTIW